MPKHNKAPSSDEPKADKKLRTLALAKFLPSKDVIAKEVIAKGKDGRLLVGRVYGVVTGFESRSATNNAGDISEEIITRGVFHFVNPLTKAEGDVKGIFFPLKFSQAESKAFEDTKLSIKAVDLDLFLVNNGKGFGWAVVSNLDNDKADIMSGLSVRK